MISHCYEYLAEKFNQLFIRSSKDISENIYAWIKSNWYNWLFLFIFHSELSDSLGPVPNKQNIGGEREEIYDLGFDDQVEICERADQGHNLR